jgi:hypothetical protein
MHDARTPAFWRSISIGALGALLVGSIALAQTPKEGADLDEATLKPRPTPVSCLANQTVDVDGALLKADRVAIQATGNCKVRVTNSRVVGRAAVMASGNAEITFENSIIDGALSLTGNSVTSFKSSTVRGRVRKLQEAAVKDLGHNLWH